MDLFKSVSKTLLIVCAAAVVIGLLLLIWPIAIMKLICFILAVALVAVGVLRIMTYSKESRAGTAGKFPNLALGLFLIMAGVMFAFESSLIVVIMPFIFALLIWFAAFYLIQHAWEVCKSKMKNWWIIGILALVALFLAIMVTVGLGGNMTFVITADIIGSETLAASTMWLTGLSMIILACEVIASNVITDTFNR